MKEQNIIKQLNSLKEIKADAGWKTRNREVLMSQIYGSQADSEATKNDWIFYFRLPMMMARGISQPTLVAFLIFVFLASGTIASVRVAKNTKPGDSLYIAKIASEKTQFALTFDQKEKAKLGIVFANNRVEEINQILAESDGSQNEEKVDTLLNDLKSQISDVKTRIAKINPSATNPINKNTEEGSEIFSASFNKDSNGVQISGGDITDNAGAIVGVTKKTEDRNATSIEQPAATSTVSVDSSQTNSMSNTTAILKEAGQLLNEDKYNDTLVKLDQVDKSVTQADQGEVKGASEAATSTEK